MFQNCVEIKQGGGASSVPRKVVGTFFSMGSHRRVLS